MRSTNDNITNHSSWPICTHLFESNLVESFDHFLFIYPGNSFLSLEWTLGAFTWAWVWLVSISYTMAGSISNYNMFLETVVRFLIIVCLSTCHYWIKYQSPGGGGTDLERGYGDVPRSWPPFFRPVGAPEPTNLPSLRRSGAPHFQILEKFSIFSLVLVKISALKMQIFRIFVPKTPHFSRKIRSLDPTFENPCGTHPPKIKLSAPPDQSLSLSKAWHPKRNEG